MSGDGNRDFTSRFVSDVSRFDVDPVAEALDDVASASEDADAALARVEGAAASARTDLDRVGTAARGAGTDLDSVDDSAATDLARVESAAASAATDLDLVGTAARGAGTDLDSVDDSAASDLDATAAAASSASTDLDAAATAARAAATDVDALATAAGAADTDVARVGEAADTASTGVGDLGDTSETSARRVREAFDRIGDAGRRVGDDVEDGSDRARGSLGEIGEEAGSTAGEMAASFDGSASSIADAFQELAANVGGAFGPIGIAAAVAAAVGIGAIRAEAERSTERVDALTEALKELGEEGASSAQTALEYLQNLDSSGLDELKESADQVGLSVQALAEIQSGSRQASEDEELAIRRNVQAHQDLSYKLGDLLGILPGISEATEKVTEDQGKAAEALAIYDEAAAAQKIQLEAQAIAAEQAATASAALATVTGEAATAVGKSWDEGADGVVASLAEIGASLDEQTLAATQYADNVIAATGKLSAEAIAYLQTLPDGGRQAFQQLTTASSEEIAKLETSVQANQVATKFAQSVVAGKGEAATAGTALADALRQQFLSDGVISASEAAQLVAATQGKITAQGDVSIKVTADTSSFLAKITSARATVQGVGTVLRP